MLLPVTVEIPGVDERTYRIMGDVMSTTFSNVDAESKIVQASVLASNPKRRRILPMLIVTGTLVVSLTWAGFLVWTVGHLFGVQN
jgi:hypothetical protein